jgi:preprotein translocase subunit SecY
MKFIDTIKNIWNITELKDRILFTLFMLVVYRFGAQITLPGIDAEMLGSLKSETSEGILGLLNAFTGGAFANASVFCTWNYAIHICFNCSTTDGNCDSISSKTSKRRR